EKAMMVDFPAISPDGRRLALVVSVDGKQSLWIRDLDSLAARPLPGTEGGHTPFWSPDSRFIGFVANDKLKKIDIAGGPVRFLCDAPNGLLASWSKKGVILL